MKTNITYIELLYPDKEYLKYLAWVKRFNKIHQPIDQIEAKNYFVWKLLKNIKENVLNTKLT